MIPQKEFENRINQARARMAEMGLKALILLDSESHLNGGNVRYLTNFVGPISPELVAAVVTADRAAVCTQPGLKGSAIKIAKQSPLVNDVFGTRSGLWGFSAEKDIKNALDAAKITHCKIGLDGISFANESMAKAIRTTLSGFELVENTRIVEEMRMVKSAAEIKSIREAARLADIGWKAFQKSIKPGGSVASAISEGEHAAKVAGAEESFMFMSPSEKPFVWGNNSGQGARRVVFKEGDMVSGELNARYDGYCAQVARAFVIGKASAEQKRYWEAGLEALKRSVAMLKPGATAAEIYLPGDVAIKEAGFKPVAHRNGHGMGLTIAEGMNVIDTDHTPMKPGYYLAVHINAPLHEDAVILLGGGFMVTETGYDDLHKVEFTLQI
jgi:Xaa-Pro aminopeptidase